jgi:hypothetical protein
MSNLPFILNVIVAVGEVKGEGKYQKDSPHRQPERVAGHSKEILKKMTEIHFGMTEVKAATAGACLKQGERVPAAHKRAIPWSPSYGQRKAKKEYCFVNQSILYSFTIWQPGAQYQILMGPKRPEENVISL